MSTLEAFAVILFCLSLGALGIWISAFIRETSKPFSSTADMSELSSTEAQEAYKGEKR